MRSPNHRRSDGMGEFDDRIVVDAREQRPALRIVVAWEFGGITGRISDVRPIGGSCRELARAQSVSHFIESARVFKG